MPAGTCDLFCSSVARCDICDSVHQQNGKLIPSDLLETVAKQLSPRRLCIWHVMLARLVTIPPEASVVKECGAEECNVEFLSRVTFLGQRV